MSDFSAWRNYLSSDGCMRIHIMPSAIQSFYINIFLLVSNLTNTGDYITLSLNYSNIVIICSVHCIVGIGCRKLFLQIFMSGFNMI